jgi:translation initiation factor IF-3
VRLVGPNGEQIGIVAMQDALRLAQEADLDLVEVAPTARPPVCKLMDYGKFKYESALKARESRKNQAQTVIKEIKLRPKIDPHDYGTKKGHVERFLTAGDKVKVTIMFRGREQSRPELGYKLLQRLASDVEELGFVEAQPKQDGRNMIMVIGPHKRKAETRTEHPEPEERPDARAERAERVAARTEAAAAAAAAAPAVEEPSGPVFERRATPPERLAPPAASRPAERSERPERSGPPSSGRPAERSERPERSGPPSSRPAERPSSRPVPSSAPRPSAGGSPSPAPRPGPATSGAPRPSAPRPAPPRPGVPRPTAPRPRPAAPVPAQQRGDGPASSGKPADAAD